MFKKASIPFPPDFVDPVSLAAGKKTFSVDGVNFFVVTVDRPIGDNGVDAIPNEGIFHAKQVSKTRTTVSARWCSG